MGLLDILGIVGGAAAPGAPAAGDQAGGFLNMLGLNDPEKRSRLGQGLIALGGSMMKAGGPSYTPTNFLGALGDGMQSFARSYGGTQDDALKRAYLKAQIGNMGANTALHQIQAAQAQQQAAARAAFNGTVNPNGSGSAAINTVPGTPAPAAPGASNQVPAPPQPLDIRPPAQSGMPQIAPAAAKPPAAVPGTAPAAPGGPGLPAQVPAPPVASAPGAPSDAGAVAVARIRQLNDQARQARAAGYDAHANALSEQAMALEKHAFSNGQVLMPDGSMSAAPGYAAGKGQVAQAESAGRAAGQLPTDLLKMDRESEIRMKEQAAKDASGDRKTFEDRAKDMNATWNANEYNKKFLAASNIRSGFDRAYADKSGLGTAQLILDWYKLNDPGSVVSQNEIQTLSTKTQSMPEGLVSAVNQALLGQGMSDDSKVKLLKNMDGKYQDQRRTYEKQRDNQRALAGKIGGVDPTMVVPDLTELHGAWKSPAEQAAEKNAAAAAGRAPALGGALAAPAGVPKFSSPNDPGFAALKPGERFEYNGQIYQKN